MNYKKGIMSGLLLTILFTGCMAKSDKMNDGNEENDAKIGISDIYKANTNKTQEEALKEIKSNDNIAIVYDSDDRNINVGIDKSATQITLENTNIILSDNSIGKIYDSTLTIQKPGTYVVSGTLKDGQIIVNSEVEGIVHLIFNDVSITSKKSAPLYVKYSTKTVITLNEGTNNYLIDSDTYEIDKEEEPNATLYSKSNISINGSGNLTVTANFRDGIVSKELKVIGSNITIKAKENGIKGSDYVAVESGTVSVVAGGVGLLVPSSEDATLGYAVIDGGSIHIKAIDVGINAGNIIKINNGDVTIKSRGMGLNALSHIYIYNGLLGIVSGKNGIQGEKSINIVGGEIKIRTNDNTTTSYGNGMKAAHDINILGGDTIIESLDNPIRSDQLVYIFDGTIQIQSGDEVIDEDELLSKNKEVINTKKNTDKESQNNTLNLNDADDTFVINGGYLIATGGTEMKVFPSENASSQNTVIVIYEKEQKANTLLYIEDDEGNVIFTFEPNKDYQTLVVSSSLLKEGVIYNLYSDDKIVKSFKITSPVTQVIVD